MSPKQSIAMESSEKTKKSKASKKGKSKTDGKNKDIDSKKKRDLKGKELAATKPSYNLQRGSATMCTDLKSLQCLHQARLRGFLRKLVMRQNWDEAALELLQHTDSEASSKNKFQDVFETWMRKLATPREWQTKDRFLVQLEYIMFCLTRGKTEEASQAVIWLRQEREFQKNRLSNLVVGLVYCQEWYDTLCMEFPTLNLRRAPDQSEMSEPEFEMSFEDPRSYIADDFQEDNHTVKCNSDASVGNYKEMECEGDPKVSSNVDIQMQTPHSFHRPQSFYVHSSENDEEDSFSGYASIFNVQGLEPWWLASRVLYTVKDLDEFLYLQKKVYNESYKGALKYLRAALDSTPPTLEALFPLVQMLLIGDQVKEAIDEVEKFSSDSPVYARYKASLFEHFDSNNHIRLSTCFEDALNKDPQCTHSLTRLLWLHEQGHYSTEKLLEMIALHLDATYADRNIWKEFASCFLKLSPSEEDRISTCNDKTLQGQSKNFNRKPVRVADSVMGKEWKLRCRWWMTRHFSKMILVSEFEADDVQLLTYKAASACHLYGQDFEYVTKVSEYLEKDINNSAMLSILQTHMQYSAGFYSKGVPVSRERKI
ncbi:uncharacterized protein LOC108192343 isoform X2 [Daucus carota subsp. sativus]|uniref:uncharacterized protein LOC108192343 isoform X2 n=1 Tax=Daucus carota subsp. sativus TaxID=79200 RepID=UPI00308275A8